MGKKTLLVILILLICVIFHVNEKGILPDVLTNLYAEIIVILSGLIVLIYWQMRMQHPLTQPLAESKSQGTQAAGTQVAVEGAQATETQIAVEGTQATETQGAVERAQAAGDLPPFYVPRGILV